MNIETKQNITSVYNSKAQAYNRLIDTANTLDRESLCQLFYRLIEDIMAADVDLCNQAKNNDDIKSTIEQLKTISTHVKNVDSITDEIFIQQNQQKEQIITENSLPSNILK